LPPGGLSRRTFLGTGIAGTAALLTGGLTSLSRAVPAAEARIAGHAPWLDKTIPQLQALMASRQLTSRELTQGYLARIETLNPLLHAVIETNPQAVAIAAQRDNERRSGHLRGPLHGIPVLVKDNIATDGMMQTTAGSLALLNSHVPSDAPLVRQLREAGAVILGKANLSEWANFRGFSYNGWSARGGFTRCPYVLGNDPLGSSSGSAVAAATNLCAVAVGTETDGSITAPSHANSTFGLKPTVGRIPGAGIIPIAHSQDTAGPITRTVTDGAILLGTLSSPQVDFTRALRRGALRHARLGIDRAHYFSEDPFFGLPVGLELMPGVLDALTYLGAELVDIDMDPSWDYGPEELTVLLYEFKVQIAEYLARLGHTRMRTLADLITFDTTHCWQEMKYFGQDIFEWADATSGNLTDPDYVNAREFCILKSRTEGIDAAMAANDLDAIVSPAWSLLISVAAVAGYPSVSLPVGYRADGTPVGFMFAGGARQEGKLLRFAYDLEQELNARRPPSFLGSVPPEPPDAGICQGTPKPHIAGEDRLVLPVGIGKANWRHKSLL
jgi:amidase